jgi:serine/threonine protein kinase
MKFQCPNCRQAIVIEDSVPSGSDLTLHSLTCPSCNSQFSFGESLEATTVAQVGRVLGQYELRELLGEGAFGSVFKAWDEKLQRFVALKIPRYGAVGSEMERTFLKEARLAAGISHPNVVGVYEIGRIDTTWFIATQLIDGISLKDRLKTKPLSERNTVELVIRILHGIQAFHDKGIIHRDLKPGNILVDMSDNPYVADFGLARRQTPSEATVSQSGQVVGTVLYMSPEQARGDVSELTNRSDLYCMGVILYEMLSGKRPFEATDSRTVLYRIMTEDPPIPKKNNHRLPRDLETICMKSLSKDPQKRYDSAMEMADDLRRYLDGKPILARPVSVLEKLAKLVGRNRLVTTVAAVAFLAVATAATLLATQLDDLRVPVMISTDTGESALKFIRYDSVLKVPFQEPPVESSSESEVRLLPGLYRIAGRDVQGRSHEVWRTVPELPTKSNGDPRFPYRSWEIDNGVVQLQSFHLFAEDEVEDSMVLVRGGEFEAGADSQPGMLAEKHSQKVDSFKVGINEVNFGQFRKMLNQPLKQGPAKSSTFLEEFNRQYGDRSDVPDQMPVSGYPIDVAIVYCELAGGRLPSCIEWEYVATNLGTTKYSTGDKPPVENPAELKLISVTESTPDTTLNGIRNLCFSVGEFTESVLITYSLLYPNKFPPKQVSASREDLARLPEMIEMRGLSRDWLTGNSPDKPVDPRVRVVGPGPIIDLDAKDVYRHVGWRMVRRVN